MEGFWRVLEGLGGFRRVLEGCGGFERFWSVQQDFGGFWRVVHGFCRVFGSFVSSANKFKSNKNFKAFAIITTIFFINPEYRICEILQYPKQSNRFIAGGLWSIRKYTPAMHYILTLYTRF